MAAKKKAAPKTARANEGKDVLKVLLTAEQRASFDQAAERAGLSVSGWLRNLGLREVAQQAEKTGK